MDESLGGDDDDDDDDDDNDAELSVSDVGEVTLVPPRRLVTFFVYLNTLPEGQGATEFPCLRPQDCDDESEDEDDKDDDKQEETGEAGASREGKQGGTSQEMVEQGDGLRKNKEVGAADKKQGGGKGGGKADTGARGDDEEDSSPTTTTTEEKKKKKKKKKKQRCLAVRPVRNKALFFCNVRRDGSADPRVVHRATPVDGGYRKYGMNIWPTDTCMLDFAQEDQVGVVPPKRGQSVMQSVINSFSSSVRPSVRPSVRS